MTRFRKKPIEIDAMCWTGDNIQDLFNWSGMGVRVGTSAEVDREQLYLFTIDGVWVPCPIGHWVIKEPVADRYYPCDPGVFADRYEPAES